MTSEAGQKWRWELWSDGIIISDGSGVDGDPTTAKAMFWAGSSQIRDLNNAVDVLNAQATQITQLRDELEYAKGEAAYYSTYLSEKLRADRLEKEITQLQGQVDELRQWKDVITDIAVVEWVLTHENERDAYKCIHDIVQMRLQIQLDPAVSEQAAEIAQLQKRAKVAEMMLAEVNGRWMVDGSSVSAETANHFFLGIMDSDQFLTEARHELATLRAAIDTAKEEIAGQMQRNTELLVEALELRAELAEEKARTKRQLVWATAGLRGKAEDDRINADKLVGYDQLVGELEASEGKLRAELEIAQGKAALLDDIVRSGHLPPSSEVYDQYDALTTVKAEEQP